MDERFFTFPKALCRIPPRAIGMAHPYTTYTHTPTVRGWHDGLQEEPGELQAREGACPAGQSPAAASTSAVISDTAPVIMENRTSAVLQCACLSGL